MQHHRKSASELFRASWKRHRGWALFHWQGPFRVEDRHHDVRINLILWHHLWQQLSTELTVLKFLKFFLHVFFRGCNFVLDLTMYPHESIAQIDVVSSGYWLCPLTCIHFCFNFSLTLLFRLSLTPCTYHWSQLCPGFQSICCICSKRIPHDLYQVIFRSEEGRKLLNCCDTIGEKCGLQIVLNIIS